MPGPATLEDRTRVSHFCEAAYSIAAECVAALRVRASPRRNRSIFGFRPVLSLASLVKAGKLRNNGLIQSHRSENDDEGEIMSTALHFPRLARMVLLGAAGLAAAGFLFFALARRARSPTEASAQDPYGGPRRWLWDSFRSTMACLSAANRRRTKAVRKKGTASEKTKKADSAAKDKSASKTG